MRCIVKDLPINKDLAIVLARNRICTEVSGGSQEKQVGGGILDHAQAEVALPINTTLTHH